MELMNMKAVRYLYAIMAVVALEAGVASAQSDTLSNAPYEVVRSWSRTTADITELKGERLEIRSTGDLRERITGLLPGLEVRQLTGEGWASGGFGVRNLSNNQFKVSFRGSNDIMCIIDDVCVPFEPFLLDPEQIESVTLLSNLVDQTRFGPLAANGAVHIRTKRGLYNYPFTVHASVESGISVTDRIPEWVNGSEYATLNNQVRLASGYSALYSDAAIRGFSAGNPYDMRYPNVDYRSFMLKKIVPTNRVGFNMFGGTGRIKYNMTLTGYNVGGIVPVSPDDYSKVNLSGSIAAMVGKYIEISGNVLTSMSFLRGGVGNWYDFRVVPAVAFPLILADSESGQTVYGASAMFADNPYAKMKEGGFKTTRRRSGLFSAAVNLDMSWLTEGLSLRASVDAMSGFHSVVGKNDDYLAYLWSPDAEYSEYPLSTVHKGKVKSSKSTFETSTTQTLNFNTRLSYARSFRKHHVSAGAAFVLENSSQKAAEYHQKQLYTVFDAAYSYDGRYNLELAAQYAGSGRFAKQHRFAWFPAAGVAWIPSNEPFLRDVKWIDRIKLYGQAALSAQAETVFGTPYLYRSDYSFDSSEMTYGPVPGQNSWFGSEHWTSQTTTLVRLANHDLTWPKVFQAVGGLELNLFNSLSFRGTYFYRKTIGSITKRVTYMASVWGLNDVTEYANFASNVTNGADGTVTLYHRFANGLYVSVGCNVACWETYYDKIIEDDDLDETQRNLGRPVDSYWGYVYAGKYQTKEQLNTLPAYTFGVDIGDLYYEDLNNSKTINFSDQKIIGNTEPRLRYSLTLDLEYKGWELHAVGTGRAFYVIPMTNEWFHNGWGDGNYSAFVRDNLGGAYPRLTYDKSNNNFIASTFWLRDGTYFKVQDVELAYNFNFKRDRAGIERLRISLKAQNPFTFTEIKYVDPENIDAGVTSYPFMKTFTAGVRLTF